MWALVKKLKSRNYIIELNKIKDGNNLYTFNINDDFLSNFEYSPVKQANTTVSVTLNKRNTLMKLAFNYTGTAHVECDTCLTEIELPIDTVFNLVVKQSEVTNLSDDEIYYLGKNEIELDLTQYLYESFLLSIPPKKGCENLPEPKPCNKEVLEKLNNQTIMQAKDIEEEHEADPRWNKLKNIIKNN